MLLLDEPFGALDAKVRQELRSWLRRFHDEIHVTSIFVTHDQEEAFEVADRVVVMNQGQDRAGGTPIEVFEHPANAFVMDFLGNVNKFPVRVEGGRALLGETGQVELPAKLLRHRRERPHRRLHPPARTRHLALRRRRQLHARRRSSTSTRPGRWSRSGCLAEDFGLMINVDLTLERYRALAI